MHIACSFRAGAVHTTCFVRESLPALKLSADVGLWSKNSGAPAARGELWKRDSGLGLNPASVKVQAAGERCDGYAGDQVGPNHMP